MIPLASAISFLFALFLQTTSITTFLPLIQIPPLPTGEPGVWGWFGNPRALHYQGQEDKTYWSAVTSQGDLVVYSYDHSTGTRTSAVLWPKLGANDHSTPALLVRSDGYIVAYYSAHNGRDLYQQVSQHSENIRTWLPAEGLDDFLEGDHYTYASVIRLGEEILLFYRDRAEGKDVVWKGTYVARSTDEGHTWNKATPLFVNGNQRPYALYAQNGATRVDFLVSDGHPAEAPGNSVYHLYYEAGVYMKSDGTPIGEPPFAPSAGTLLWRGDDEPGWGWDIYVGADRIPRVAYASYTRDLQRSTYHVAHWDGSTWQEDVSISSGGVLYGGALPHTGGITFDRIDPTITYASLEHNGFWQLWEYGNGKEPIALTAPTPMLIGRPTSPENASPKLRLLWWQGRYTDYADFDTVILWLQ